MDTEILVGTVVELTRDEQRRIEELTHKMYRAAKTRRPGFIGELYTTFPELARVMKGAVARSHGRI